MTVEGAVLNRLRNHAGLTAEISSRSYNLKSPQRPVYPLVVFQRISGVREHAMGNDPGIVRTRFQIGSYAETYEKCKDVSDQVVVAFRRWSDTQDGTQVDDTFVEGERDLFEPELGENGIYRSLIDVLVHHRE